jgi:hypothetical protein
MSRPSTPPPGTRSSLHPLHSPARRAERTARCRSHLQWRIPSPCRQRRRLLSTPELRTPTRAKERPFAEPCDPENMTRAAANSATSRRQHTSRSDCRGGGRLPSYMRTLHWVRWESHKAIVRARCQVMSLHRGHRNIRSMYLCYMVDSYTWSCLKGECGHCLRK